MPQTYYVTLQLLEPLPPQPQQAVHSVVYDLLARADAERAQQLHGAQLSPFSLGLTRYRGFGGTLGADRQTLQFRLGNLQEDLRPLLEQALCPGDLIPISQGSRAYIQGRVVGLYIETATYQELLTPARELTLHLISPAVLRAGDRYLEEFRADTVLHGLLRRWNTFAPQLLPPEAWETAGGLRPDLSELRRVRVTLPKARRTVPAFEGKVRFVLDAAAAPLIAPLCHLTEWSGIGTKTLYSFGETAPEITAFR